MELVCIDKQTFEELRVRFCEFEDRGVEVLGIFCEVNIAYPVGLDSRSVNQVVFQILISAV